MTPRASRSSCTAGPTRSKLRDAGFSWRVEDADLRATMAKAARRRHRRTPRPSRSRALPSGRTSYRTLDEINAELDQLAADYPNLVKPLTLDHPTRRGPPGARHRDHDERGERRRRQAGVPHDGRAPRPRVALGRAQHGVRLRPADQPGQRRPGPRHRREDPHDHRAGGQRRRLPDQPLRGAARQLLDVRLRDEAQELHRSRRHPGAVPDGHLRRQPRRPPARHRPQPQLPRLLGRTGREHELEQRHLPW